ncbi:MAG: hypothetical protein R2698_14750 [Microthrixaceae bacterium]
MRRHKVRYEQLPKVGDLFEFDTESERTITVIVHRSGTRELAIGDPGDEEPFLVLDLTENEALALATILTGNQIDLSTTPRTWPTDP